MNNKLGRLAGGLLLALNAGLASAAYQLNFQPPVTRIASEIYDLHTLMMVIIVIVFMLKVVNFKFTRFAATASFAHSFTFFRFPKISFLILPAMKLP